jgi:hypothetical protein
MFDPCITHQILRLTRTCGGFLTTVTAVITVWRIDVRKPLKSTLNLASAMQAVASSQGQELTLTELVRAYATVHLDGSDRCLRAAVRLDHHL